MEIHLDRPQSPPPLEETPLPLECIPWCLEQLCLTIYGIWEAFCLMIWGPRLPVEGGAIVRVDNRGYKAQQHAGGLPPQLWITILGMLSEQDFMRAAPTCKATAFTFRELVDFTHRVDYFSPRLMQAVNLDSVHTLNVNFLDGNPFGFALATKKLTTINCSYIPSFDNSLIEQLNAHPILQKIQVTGSLFSEPLLDLVKVQNLPLNGPLSRENASKLAKHPGIEQIVCGTHNGSWVMDLATWNAFLAVPHLRSLQISSPRFNHLPKEAFARWENAQVETLILHVDFGSELTPKFEMLADCKQLSTLCLDFWGWHAHSCSNRDILMNIGKCTQLKRLALSIHDLDYYCLPCLANCTKLEHLHIHFPETIVPQNFVTEVELRLKGLLKKLPEMKVLSLSSPTTNFPYNSVFDFAKTALALQEAFPKISITATSSADGLYRWQVR